MSKIEKLKRNLKPTAEAKMAMYIWGKEYSGSTLGSMDFWDSLSDGQRNIATTAVKEIIEAKKGARG